MGKIFCQDFILNKEKEFLIWVYTHDFSNYLYLNIDYHNEDIQFHILQMETLLFPASFLSALGCLWYFLKEVIDKHHKYERMHCTCCGAGIFHSTSNFKSVYVFQCSNHPFNCKNNTSNLHNISILWFLDGWINLLLTEQALAWSRQHFLYLLKVKMSLGIFIEHTRT